MAVDTNKHHKMLRAIQTGTNSNSMRVCGNFTDDPRFHPLTFCIAHCTKYLCPDTLGNYDTLIVYEVENWGADSDIACVHFPHHCPCPHPAVEEKVELGDGSMLCISKGGYKAGESARKVELARKGLI